MGHPDVDKVLEWVRARTGYAVSVVPQPGLRVLSTVRAASPEAPAHTILVDPAQDRALNFLVAQQALMLLLKWGEGGEVVDFFSTPERTEFVERKAAEKLKGSSGNDATGRQRAHALVEGLLLQLASTPMVLLAGSWCLRDFPSLREEQELMVAEELRRGSSILAPGVRTGIPEELFDRSATMNAAHALWWAEASENRHAALPYQATGYAEKGKALLEIVKGLDPTTPDAYPRAVDGWAEALQMVGWYAWHRRKG
jgi:hypothetical protein